MPRPKIPVELRIRQLTLRIQLLTALSRSDGGKTDRAREARARANEYMRERSQLRMRADVDRANRQEEAA